MIGQLGWIQSYGFDYYAWQPCDALRITNKTQPKAETEKKGITLTVFYRRSTWCRSWWCNSEWCPTRATCGDGLRPPPCLMHQEETSTASKRKNGSAGGDESTTAQGSAKTKATRDPRESERRKLERHLPKTLTASTLLGKA